MCDYCNMIGKRLLTVEMGEFETGEKKEMYVEICGGLIRAYDNDYQNSSIDSIQINFCPMCGRKLREKTENSCN